MTLKEFEDLIYDMWYPDEALKKKRVEEYQSIPRSLREELLLSVLKSDADGLVWRAACLLLKDDRNQFLPAVLSRLEHQNPEVRFVVCAVFHDMKINEAGPAIEKLARCDNSPRVRHVAIRALGRCGGTSSVQILQHIAETERGDDGQGRPLSDAAKESLNELRELGF